MQFICWAYYFTCIKKLYYIFVSLSNISQKIHFIFFSGFFGLKTILKVPKEYRFPIEINWLKDQMSRHLLHGLLKETKNLVELKGVVFKTWCFGFCEKKT